MSNGTVVSIWRYPVKSMMGEELNAADVTGRGVLGDRAYALVDSSDGKVATAKNPRKWPALFDFRAAFVRPPRLGEELPPIRITLPDGTLVSSEQADCESILSRALGRNVVLETEPPQAPHLEEYWPNIEGLAHQDTVTDEATLGGTFFDLSVLHLVTTATLDRLRELYPNGRLEARRFRPNFVIETGSGERSFVENAWIGGTLAIGNQVRLRITGPCPRCVMTTLPQGDLPKDPGILRTAVAHNEGNVGVYAEVLQGGAIRRGDAIRLEQ